MNSIFSDKLSQALASRTPFALYRKPNETDIYLLVNDDSEQNIFLIHSFDNKSEKSVSDRNPLTISQNEFNFESELNLNSSPDFTSISEDNYIRLIQRTVDKIKSSEINKIVISRLKLVQNSSFNVLKSFKNLTQIHPQALVYLWHHPENETWMAATPELLLSLKENKIQTVSLAGTKLPNAEWTPKEYEEQKIVTDYIIQQFSEVQNLSVEGPETVEAGKFQHLKTYISGETGNDFQLKNLLDKMHPTPAVCGLPKEKAFDFILKNEGYDRDFYSGYVGIKQENSEEYFVNLRCAQFFEEQIRLYVGGGITAESIPENEWKETELKSGTLTNGLVT